MITFMYYDLAIYHNKLYRNYYILYCNYTAYWIIIVYLNQS